MCYIVNGLAISICQRARQQDEEALTSQWTKRNRKKVKEA